jgi:hypothetical protein
MSTGNFHQLWDAAHTCSFHREPAYRHIISSYLKDVVTWVCCLNCG